MKKVIIPHDEKAEFEKSILVGLNHDEKFLMKSFKIYIWTTPFLKNKCITYENILIRAYTANT